jgi:hypothetical protein
MDLSAYSAESFMMTLFDSGDFEILVDEEMIPATSGFSLTTTSLNDFLPGLVDVYGDQPMEIFISAVESPRMAFTPEDMSVSLSIAFDFRVVNNGTAVLLTFGDINSVFDLLLTNFTLYPTIDSVKFGSITAT